MPKIAKQHATHVETMAGFEGRYEDLDGYTIGFETYTQDADPAPLFQGLPGDRCQCPHWGVVLTGTLVYNYADGGQTSSEPARPTYAPPGPLPVLRRGDRDRRVQPGRTAQGHHGSGHQERPRGGASMSALTRDHVRIDGADALLDQIATALAGPDMATGVLGRIGDRLARGVATLDLAAARRASISSGRSVVIAHRPGGPALAVRWFSPGVPTTIHGHGTWGVAVVAEGHQVCERWEATGAGRAQPGRRTRAGGW